MVEMVVARTTILEPVNVADHTQNVSLSILEKQHVAMAKSAVSAVVKYSFSTFLAHLHIQTNHQQMSQ